MAGSEDIVLGLEEEVTGLKDQLLGESSSPLKIISIVGMGGIGKSTLAKTLYQDNAVRNHFDVRFWIIVSQTYDARGALLSILNSGQEYDQQMSNEQLAIRVYQTLKRRRYLIIVDDIWHKAVWDDIKKSLPDDCNGSRVMITTRETYVADYTGSCHTHQMRLMDEDLSWDLLEKKVFGQEKSPLELSEIGITIAQKCKGLPLAITVIAGLLQVDQNSDSWKKIAQDVNSAIMYKTDEHHVVEILSLSYHYMPAWLKPCFLYLGGFQEDYEISVSNLIRLWMAEGFLKPGESNKSLEEIGVECLGDLIKRNLVSVRKKRWNGLPKTCSLHDLIREMCIKQSQDDDKFLHLSCDLNPFIRKPAYFTSASVDMEACQLLRVLRAGVTKELDDGFPSRVCGLVQLGYLSFTFKPGRINNWSPKIPAGIRNFVNLQTLILQYSEHSVSFPSEIWFMRNLRHLVVERECILPDPTPDEEFHPLVGLQTIAEIYIADNTGRLFRMIPNIRKLNVKSSSLSLHNNIQELACLHHLENLTLLLYDNEYLRSPPCWPDIAFPASLTKLKMFRTFIPWEYVTTVFGSLPNLEVLHLREDACLLGVWETREGCFPKLKQLQISTSDIKIWTMESSNDFPRLEQRKLYMCRDLEELPSCLGESETLQLIDVDYCNPLVGEWAKMIEEEQRDLGNELLQVYVDRWASQEQDMAHIFAEEIEDPGDRTMSMGENTSYDKITCPDTGTDNAKDLRVMARGEDIVLGLEEELTIMKDQLLGKTFSLLKIISIVGMGGIGKSTLARTVYEDNEVSSYFDVVFWITVSQTYDARGALLSLLNSSQEENKQISNEQLASRVHQRLKRRRYLIILDDIRHEVVWDDIKKSLPDDCNGSRIIVTTRETDVADYIGSSYIHHMRLMDEDRSWDLLENVVFRGDKSPPELSEIGITIARKCKGLPLAIIVIAGLLQVDRTLDSWKKIAQDVNSAIGSSDEHRAFEILSLCCDSLPASIKPCFLYLAGFPEDYEIPVSNLIRLWMAEGFLKSRESKDLEEIGIECLEDLIKRNLISVCKTRWNGHTRSCSLHDLIREMCIKKSHDDHHQGICRTQFSSLRNTLYFTDISQDFEAFQLLTVLDAALATKDGFTSQVCKLVQLRYLALTYKTRTPELEDPIRIPMMPMDICNFLNLQTLVLHYGEDWVFFPSEIWRMPKLRHLIVKAGAILPDPSPDEEAHPLVGLQTLLDVYIADNTGRLLKMIPNVRKLRLLSSIMSLHNIEDLASLDHLESLSLFTYHIEHLEFPPSWQNIAFPASLRKVKMYNTLLPWEYVTTIFGSLPNLEVLQLRQHACLVGMWETKEGCFLKLRVLQISISDIKIWRMESSDHFPRLEQLRLYMCPDLEEVPWCLGDSKTLQMIDVDYCNEYVNLWAERIGLEQRCGGNELFHVYIDRFASQEQDVDDISSNTIYGS